MKQVSMPPVEETRVPALKLLGQRVREVREFRKLTAKQLSVATRISQSELSKIENGAQNVSHDYVDRLAGALEVTLDYIAGKEDAELALPAALAIQSLRLFLRQKKLTSRQTRYVQRVVGTPNAPTDVEAWGKLIANVALWDKLQSG